MLTDPMGPVMDAYDEVVDLRMLQVRYSDAMEQLNQGFTLAVDDWTRLVKDLGLSPDLLVEASTEAGPVSGAFQKKTAD